MAPQSVLLISNGQGEDAIGARLAERLRDHMGVAVTAWPMVGIGSAYHDSSVDTWGPPNLLPSEGFATLDFLALLRDIWHGWVPVHLRQARAAATLAHSHTLLVAIGDIVPILAATMARTPYLFVGCAKSEYYGRVGRYNGVERWLLRRGAVATYARDERTALALRAHGVRARYAGNPVMDALPTSGAMVPWSADETVIACLPGSRLNREENARQMLTHFAVEQTRYARLGNVHFAFAVTPAFDRTPLIASAEQNALSGWSVHGSELRCGVLRATFTAGALVPVLHRARAAVGLAGTANEQAIGLGVPLVTFATSGPQGAGYLDMKMRFFGDSAMCVPDEATAVAVAVEQVACDKPLRQRMIAAGRERMGSAGALDAVAAHVATQLASTPSP